MLPKHLSAHLSSIASQKSSDLSAKKASGWSQICVSCLLVTAPCCPIKSLEAPLASLAKGKIDYEDIMNNFIKWLNDSDYTSTGEAFDVGRTCLKAIITYLLYNVVVRGDFSPMILAGKDGVNPSQQPLPRQ